MKYISLLLLFSSICFAQGVKITAYRLVDEIVDGPCSVDIYLKYGMREYYPSYVFSAQSTDVSMAKTLLKIKEDAKKWQSIPFACSENMIGGDMINNMFIIENNQRKDTLFATGGNIHIVYPAQRKAYIVKENVLNKALTGIVKELFEYDFKNDIRGMANSYRESVPNKDVLYKGKSLDGYTKQKFEQEFGKLVFVGEREGYGVKAIAYSFENNIYTFIDNGAKLLTVEVVTPDSGWSFDKIIICDKRELLVSKYPVAMSFNYIEHTEFEDHKKENLHYINLINGEQISGSIGFWIKDGLLNRFEINFP